MKPLQSTIALAAIGAASFGVGHWLGTPDTTGSPPGHARAYAALGDEEAASLIAAAAQSPSSLEQSVAMTGLMQGMQAQDFERLAPAVEASFSVGMAALPAQLFVERWAQLDPTAAHERVLAWSPDIRHKAMPGLMRSWARIDPDAALAALAALENRGLRQASRRGLIEGWAEDRDPAIWTYIARLAQGRTRRESMVIAMQQISAAEGPDGLLMAIEALPAELGEDDFKTEAMGMATSTVARLDLDHAAAAASSCVDAQWCPAMASAVATRWAGLDGAAACEWTRGLAAGDIRDRAQYSAYSSWYRQKTAAAKAWLDDQKAADDLASMYSARGRIAAHRNLAAAVRWADAVEQLEMRREAQMSVGRVYRRKDPAGAQQWLEAQGLDKAVPAFKNKTAAAE